MWHYQYFRPIAILYFLDPSLRVLGWWCLFVTIVTFLLVIDYPDNFSQFGFLGWDPHFFAVLDRPSCSLGVDTEIRHRPGWDPVRMPKSVCWPVLRASLPRRCWEDRAVEVYRMTMETRAHHFHRWMISIQRPAVASDEILDERKTPRKTTPAEFPQRNDDKASFSIRFEHLYCFLCSLRFLIDRLSFDIKAECSYLGVVAQTEPCSCLSLR